MLPSAIINQNAGTGASVVLSRMALRAGASRYKVRLVTGSANRASGAQCTVSFGYTLTQTPAIALAPGNAETASLMSTLNPTAIPSTSGFTIEFANVDAASHRLCFTCIVS